MSEQDLEKSAGFVVQLRGFQEFCNSKFFSENSTVFEIYIVLLKSTFHIGTCIHNMGYKWVKIDRGKTKSKLQNARAFAM